MPFDQEKYHRPASAGDVGYCVYVAQTALSSLVQAIEKISKHLGTDVSSDLESVRRDMDILQEEFDNLTGWKSE